MYIEGSVEVVESGKRGVLPPSRKEQSRSDGRVRGVGDVAQRVHVTHPQREQRHLT